MSWGGPGPKIICPSPSVIELKINWCISHILQTNSPWQAAANELVFVIDDGGDDGAAEHPSLRLPHHPQQEDLWRGSDQDHQQGPNAQQAEGEYEYYPLNWQCHSVSQLRHVCATIETDTCGGHILGTVVIPNIKTVFREETWQWPKFSSLLFSSTLSVTLSNCFSTFMSFL